jgi:hypothetical protein
VERITDEGVLFGIQTGMVPDRGNRLTIDDLIMDNFMPACSVVHRRSALGDPPEWIRDLAYGDWPMAIIAAKSGFIDRLDGIVARYRWHRQGAWSGLTETEQWITALAVLNAIESHLGHARPAAFARSRAAIIDSLQKAIKAETPGALVELRVTIAERDRTISQLNHTLGEEKKRLRRRAKRILAAAAVAVVAAAVLGWVLAKWL